MGWSHVSHRRKGAAASSRTSAPAPAGLSVIDEGRSAQGGRASAVLPAAPVQAGEPQPELQTFLSKFGACCFQVGVLGTKLITASRGTDGLRCVHGILTINISKVCKRLQSTMEPATRFIGLQPQICHLLAVLLGFRGDSVVKNPPAKPGDPGTTPGSGRSCGGGNGNPLQYSCLGNPVDRGA